MSAAVLSGRELRCGYGKVEVLRGVDIEVHAGEVVALLGPNGAGKTTLLFAIAGLIDLTSGVLDRQGVASSGAAPHRIARSGITFAPEKNLFMNLTVEENIRVAGVSADQVFQHFPELARFPCRRVGSLSGGEQQMLNIGRALAARPALLLIDELSLGLAPLVVSRLLEAIRLAADDGMAALLVEQHISRALSIADRGYVLSRGEVALSGSAAELLADRAAVTRSYLGGS